MNPINRLVLLVLAVMIACAIFEVFTGGEDE